MSPVNVVTLTSHAYVPFTRVMARTFLEHHPGGRIFAFLGDDLDHEVNEAEEPFEAIRPDQIGFGRDDLHRMLIMHGDSFFPAVKPWIMETMVKLTGGPVLFIDSDVQIFGSLDHVADAAEEAGVVLCPHVLQPMPQDGLMPEDSSILSAGMYNGGFFGVGTKGEGFIRFLQDRLRWECLAAPLQMRMAEQRWLDFVPSCFPHHILKDPGCNVAYWNLHERPLRRVGDRLYAGDALLRFFHYSGYDFVKNPTVLSRFDDGRPRVAFDSQPLVAELCRRFAAEVMAAGYGETKDLPYAYLRLGNGAVIDPMLSALYRHYVIAAEKGLAAYPPDPYDEAQLDAFDEWALNAYRRFNWQLPPWLRARLGRIGRESEVAAEATSVVNEPVLVTSGAAAQEPAVVASSAGSGVAAQEPVLVTSGAAAQEPVLVTSGAAAQEPAVATSSAGAGVVGQGSPVAASRAAAQEPAVVTSGAAAAFLVDTFERIDPQVALDALQAHLDQPDHSPASFVEALPDDRLLPFLAQVARHRPALADTLLEESWHRYISGNRSLEFGTILASLSTQVPVERILVWATRMAKLGDKGGRHFSLAPLCVRHLPSERIRSTASYFQIFKTLGFTSFGVDEASACITESASRLAGLDQRMAARAALGALAGELLGAFDAGVDAAESAERRRAPDISAGGAFRYTASIVIPIRNQATLAIRCLQFLAEVTAPQDFEVILVDDASTDGTPALCAALQGDVQSIRIDRSLGPAHAWNEGAALAKGRTLVFLGPDVEPRGGWLESLLAALASDPGVGVVGSRLLFPDGTLRHAGMTEHVMAEGGGVRMTRRGFGAPAGRGVGDVAEEVDAVSGEALAIGRDLFTRIGGFDEHVPAGVAEGDLCRRVRAAGMKVLLEPASEMVCATPLPEWSAATGAGAGVEVPGEPRGDEMGRGGGTSTAGRERLSPGRRNSLLWVGPMLDFSGYSDEARGFVLGLRELGYPVTPMMANSPSVDFALRLERSSFSTAVRMQESFREPFPRGEPVAVVHAPGYVVQKIASAYTVARTTFETDGLPADWIERLNKVDEVWVPASFNEETFRRAGIERPISVVPEGVDHFSFRPGLEPLDIPGRRGTVFLSVFEWSHRKGWDVLLRAWAEAFAPDDAVSLVIRSYAMGSKAHGLIDERIDTYLGSLGYQREKVAPIVTVKEPVALGEMPRLYASGDVYVSASRGEGWGRPLLEAMACGLPTIATRWSGNLDFMDDGNSLLVDVERFSTVDARMEIPFYHGHRWAEPSVEHLVELLRRSAVDADLRRSLGERARADVEERWTWAHAARVAAGNLERIAGESRR